MTVQTALHSVPVSDRPRLSWRRTLIAVAFCIFFDLACLMINGSQFAVLLPLRFIPFQFAKRLYKDGIHYTKGSFACLLILTCQWFAPTSLSITFETSGRGAFTQEEIDTVVTRDSNGGASLKLPRKFVFISNHQVYADWWYAWCLLYYIQPQGVHQHIFITLKKSLQWIPVLGWGMQFFDFIFLARSWASDRNKLATHLSAIGKEAAVEDHPFAFVLYPEGTLVSQDTRPISKKFADRIGVTDMTNILLPRSTGLHYSLRSLAPRIPDLHLIDATIVYPGIPPLGYGQSYYTLRSIFIDGVPPPTIHVHLRKFNVATQIPIGNLLASNPATVPKTHSQEHVVEVEIPEQERIQFDEWLREIWQEKDQSMTRFFEVETFSTVPQVPVKIPLELRRTRHYVDAFCFFIPACAGYLWRVLRSY